MAELQVKTLSLRANVVANYLGQGWRALMGLAFVPLYVKYVGVEAYGLIGVFTVLQAGLSLLDLGMRPTLSRELARFTGGEHSPQSIRNLVRTVEVMAYLVAAVIVVGIFALARWLASDWLTVKELSVDVVSRSIDIMGIVIGLRLVENVYVSVIVGLQRQVMENVTSSILATLRGVGAVGVLAWISPTISAFFACQAIVSMIGVLTFAVLAHRALPRSPQRPAFSRSALVGVWRFALGMMAITLSSLLLTQTDKILLSRLLSLESFGYYVFAAAVANALYMLVTPITTAMYPRFTEYVSRGDDAALRRAYHQSSQLVSVSLGVAAVLLVFFGNRLLLLWTGNAQLTAQVAPLLSVLAFGTLLNGLMWVPYQMQLAHGWTSLVVKFNFLAVVLLAPGTFLAVRDYGAIGAAWVWVALNSGYLVFIIYFMHKRVLSQEAARWYLQDVLAPLAAAVGTAALLRWAVPGRMENLMTEVCFLLASAACVTLAAAMAAPQVRDRLVVGLLRPTRWMGDHS